MGWGEIDRPGDGPPPVVNREDPEDCPACYLAADLGGTACLYHEGWAAGHDATCKALTFLLDDSEALFDTVGRIRQARQRNALAPLKVGRSTLVEPDSGMGR